MNDTRIAFFDVDETLIDIKSMFSFLEFHLDAPDLYRRAAAELTGMAEAGVPREETNRIYYRNYAGMPEAVVAESGRRWFARQSARDGFFHTEVVRKLRRLQVEGVEIALVSGSFRACLDPVAAYLNADHVLCTEPEIIAGRYTSRVLTTMIGEEKATAARTLMRTAGARPEECFAYGDHVSDFPLLLTVGNPGIVGNDPELSDYASRFGWTRLPHSAPSGPSTEEFTYAPR